MERPELTTRRATETDLVPLYALLLRYYNEWGIWERDDEPAVLAVLQQPNLGFFIVEAEAEIAGCMLCKSLPHLDQSVECKRLFVSPEFRGHGIASLLMDVAERSARAAGAPWMYLDSKPEFANAIALYRRRGYVDCPRYNDNAQATVFLRKDLSS
jgi:ribosomal protein S18 acetylase RimI-like enzyme